jgi:hypothetical protein
MADRPAGIRPTHLYDGSGLRLDELELLDLLDLVVEILEAVDGADIDVVDADVRLFAEGVAHVGALLERGHAANAGAVHQRVAVARAGALDEGNLLRLLTVRGTQQLFARCAHRSASRSSSTPVITLAMRS